MAYFLCPEREASVPLLQPRPRVEEVSRAECDFGTDLPTEAAVGGGWATAVQSSGHLGVAQTNLSPGET